MQDPSSKESKQIYRDTTIPPHVLLHALLNENNDPSAPKTVCMLLDSARDAAVWQMLERLDPRTRLQSLFQGETAEELAEVCPYLVELPVDPPLWRDLFDASWENAWGLFVVSERPFAEIRRHLRKFTIVNVEGERPVLFRFWDPRVMRIFLPTCDAEQIKSFLEPLESLWAEGGEGDIRRYHYDAAAEGGLVVHTHGLTPGTKR